MSKPISLSCPIIHFLSDLSPVDEEADSSPSMLFIIVGAVGVLMLSMAIIAVLLYRNVVKHIKPTTGTNIQYVIDVNPC